MNGSVRRALDSLRRGRPVLVLDGADRENGGDVVLPAHEVDAGWVAWTVRHTSGLLCAPMTAECATALGLPAMVAHSEDPRGTAYAVTVDARHGVTTGISARDRALTLRLLAGSRTSPSGLVRPGHVLPLRAPVAWNGPGTPKPRWTCVRWPGCLRSGRSPNWWATTEKCCAATGSTSWARGTSCRC